MSVVEGATASANISSGSRAAPTNLLAHLVGQFDFHQRFGFRHQQRYDH